MPADLPLLIRFAWKAPRGSDPEDNVGINLQADGHHECTKGTHTRELNDCFEWDRCIVETPENIWAVMKGPKGLWVVYCNAGVMLEMVDYTVRHGANVDRGLVDGIRSAASSIRSCALKALGHYAVTYAWDAIYDNAFLAASQYLDVIRRMQELLLAAGLVEEFKAT